MPWYVYNAGGTNVSNPNNYILIGSTAPTCTSPKLFLCAIQANDNMGWPTVTNALILEIANAVNNVTESTNVKLRATR
ncbi:hypothetical protein ACFX5U_15585 [Sphingobacterium sp. SG20118]|uniref:hypothetical protein n=1 Tax=Sphingobacterium sp. SG20118 TaxID=3367156 RepID=UPI0037DFC0D7